MHDNQYKFPSSHAGKKTSLRRLEIIIRPVRVYTMQLSCSILSAQRDGMLLRFPHRGFTRSLSVCTEQYSPQKRCRGLKDEYLKKNCENRSENYLPLVLYDPSRLIFQWQIIDPHICCFPTSGAGAVKCRSLAILLKTKNEFGLNEKIVVCDELHRRRAGRYTGRWAMGTNQFRKTIYTIPTYLFYEQATVPISVTVRCLDLLWLKAIFGHFLYGPSKGK